MKEGWFTIGIEEEFQIVDDTGDLRAHIDILMASAKPTLGDELKPEFLQSFVEIGTKVCANVAEARQEIMRLRGTLHAMLAENGLRLASAGTHPFSHWKDQIRTEHERYQQLEEEMQDVIRELLIFGMHVHVGIPDRELRIEIMNEARYFLPHLMALSTSSPFWLGRNTGLKSYRGVVWSRFPRTGIPPEFGSCTRVEETVMIAALIQAICAKLLKLRESNLGFRKYLPTLIGENKWRAMRHGIDGKLIDFGKQAETPMRDLALELLEFVDDVVDELGSRPAVEHVHAVLEEGTSADRQLAVYRDTGDLKKVVDHLSEETVSAPLA